MNSKHLGAFLALSMEAVASGEPAAAFSKPVDPQLTHVERDQKPPYDYIYSDKPPVHSTGEGTSKIQQAVGKKVLEAVRASCPSVHVVTPEGRVAYTDYFAAVDANGNGIIEREKGDQPERRNDYRAIYFLFFMPNDFELSRQCETSWSKPMEGFQDYSGRLCDPSSCYRVSRYATTTNPGDHGVYGNISGFPEDGKVYYYQVIVERRPQEKAEEGEE